jgi:PAS domain S-box-containing protein
VTDEPLVNLEAADYLGILFRQSPVPMWILDRETRRYVSVNEAALRAYGYSRDEFLRLRPEDLRLPQDRASLEASLAATGEGPVAQGPALHVCRDGTLLDVEVTTQDIVLDGRRARVVMALDVTAPARAAYRLARLHAVTSVLARALTPEEVARAVVDEGIAALGARSGSLALAAVDGAALEIVRARGYAAEQVERYRTLPLDSPFPLTDAARERRPVFLAGDAERDARYPHLEALRRTNGSGAMAAVPLLFEGRVLGAIGLNFPEGFALGDDERAFVLNLAQQAAQALERARLFEAERRARAAAEQLQDLTAALAVALTLEQVGAVGMTLGVASLGADAGVLALLTVEGDEVEILASLGYAPEACMGPGRRWSAEANIPVAEATRTGAPVLVGSPEAWAARYTGGAYVRTSTASAAWAALPLVVGGAPAGALLWTWLRPREFPPAEAALMETVARLCSQALERARLLEAERRARDEAEAANRAKTEFLSAMSHELRTPLNAIVGYVDLLEMGLRGPVTEAQLHDLGRIKSAQGHLLGIIDDILNFARVEAGRLEYASEPIEVMPLLDELETLLAPQLAERGLRYARACDPGLVALGDRDRVRQILVNLLSNAVKFTDRGGLVEVSAGEEGERIAVRVRDTGRGIARERLEEVFDPFVQIDRHRTESAQQGVGLGLAISRELARGMGAELTAWSVPGEGSCFTLALPRAQAEPTAGLTQSR